MGRRTKALAAAALAAVAVNLIGVIFFFRPIAESDSVGRVPPPAVGFLIYVVLSVLVLDRAVRRFGEPVRVALLIAAAQVILIMDLALRGDRGLMTAAAGSLLALVAWTAMGFVYGRVLGRTAPAGEGG